MNRRRLWLGSSSRRPCREFIVASKLTVVISGVAPEPLLRSLAALRAQVQADGHVLSLLLLLLSSVLDLSLSFLLQVYSPCFQSPCKLLSAHRDFTETILYVFPSWLFNTSIDLDLLVVKIANALPPLKVGYQRSVVQIR